MRYALCWILLLVLPAWAADVEGKVSLKSTPRAFKRGESKQDAGYEGDHAGPPTRNELECVLVCLEGPNLKCTPRLGREPDNTVVQKDYQFLPHVLAVPVGSKVWFRNEDNFIHRVYSVSDPAKFDFRGFKGQRDVDFPHPGVVEIFCGIHTRMNAYIYVTRNDFFARADGNGRFRIRNVPPGTYTLKLWHPRLDAREQKVTVPGTGSVKLDLTL